MFSRGNRWSTRMLASSENGKTGKFLWSLSLLIRPDWYPDSYINTCFSDLKHFGITKKFFGSTNVEKFSLLEPSLLRNIFVQIVPGVTRCILSLNGFPCNRVRVRVI